MIFNVLVLVAYFVFFAVLHSLLADPRFKSRAKKVFGEIFDRWQRLAYVLLALFMVLPFLYILIFLPDKTLYIISAPWSWLMAGGQILAAVALLLTLSQTGVSYFLGLSQLGGANAPTGGEGGLVTDGFYGHIRNPLFFFAAVFLWLSPVMTEGLLAFNILAMIYFYLGARHEERSLKEEFGQEYEDYKEKVPMFLPRLMD
jgi:protein-S-isoprenylcysteine O-methyltransferase Ste14